MFTDEQIKEMRDDGIVENSMDEKLIEINIQNGMNFKDAYRYVIEGKNNMKSETFSQDDLERIKKAMSSVQGQWV